MKKLWLLVVALVLVSASALAVEVGKPAPALEGKDLSGKPVSLAALKGKVVILDFMASWCAPCKEELPALEKLHQRYKAHGLVIIGVSVDEKRENLEKFMKDVPVSFSVMHDDKKTAAKAYGPSRMPSSYIVDKAGVIRHVHGGFRAGDEKKIEAEVRALLK
jgi:cytochrome c biogenesis protein CcmG, thiol:disulfide interchange protein DsbE